MEINSLIDAKPNVKEEDGGSAEDRLDSRLLPRPRDAGPQAAHWENGRAYHGHRRGVYMLPCDEQEQDRLDIFHRVITTARHHARHSWMPPPRGRVLDLGCGTGIWAIETAEQEPRSFVAGVDLSPIQPAAHPVNCDFYAPFDFEGPWALGEGDWDLIHLQMGSGTVTSWPSLYRRILNHLRPGAWFEQVEIDFEPRYCRIPLGGLLFPYWYDRIRYATEVTGRPFAHDPQDTMQHLHRVGFRDIGHHQIPLPIGPWAPGSGQRDVGGWYSLAITRSIEALSLAPFSRVYGWTAENIRFLNDQVTSEILNLHTEGYNVLHIYHARRPLD